jgi:putative flippase GtrA
MASLDHMNTRDPEEQLLRLHQRYLSTSRRHDRAVGIRRFLGRAVAAVIGIGVACIVSLALTILFPELAGTVRACVGSIVV